MTDSLAQNVLDYWHSVEFFNHYDLGDVIKTARSNERREFFISTDRMNTIEWEKHEDKVRYLYLLPFDVSQVTDLATSRIASKSSALEQQRDQEHAPEGLTCFAQLRLTAEGIPDFKSLSLSTLPWAAGMLQHGSLDQLSASTFEASVVNIKEKIESAWSCRTDEKCSTEFILVLAELLVDWAGFQPRGKDIAWIDVQKDQSKFQPKLASPPREDDTQEDPPAPVAEELPILNSFYYHDLKFAAAALKQAHAPHPLHAYLSAGGIDKLDLETAAGERAIHDTLDPAQTNAGRWPTEPKLLQSLMQQFALNKMRALPAGGLLSVNGPPGTGKTTLVKDLIADLIVQRAEVLATLAAAKDGISSKPALVGFGTDAPTQIPTLIPALTGFEIVIASSNNGAVENLSLELPQLKDIAADYKQTLRHFGEVATKYAGTQNGKPWKKPEHEVWGLISAALGKSKNRQRFQQIFGYNAEAPSKRPGDRFLKKEQVDIDAWDAEGAMNYWRFTKERKHSLPSFDSAKRRFLQAKADYAKYEAHQLALRKKWLAFVDAWVAAKPALELLADLQRDPQPLADELDARIRQFGRQLEQLELTLWPSMFRWLMRWFSKQKFAAWLDAKSRLLHAENLRDDLAIILKLQEKTGQLHLWDGLTLDSHRNQEAALWHGPAYNQLRNELFAAAMELHQAFVLEAASSSVGIAISNLLSKRVTQGTPLPVWQWLFMLVPVVSSTFASVRNQFRGVEPGSLGWLIIDEAGQAIPQAAVGALLRARRAVVVGDPLQIEPVVGIPTKLIERLGEVWLGEHAGAYAAHHHSVQTLSDRAHGYGVRHPLREEEFIGIPLVMHRRCDNPMFDIANKIAYRERMRHAKEAEVTAHPVLGKSDWWDVKGTCQQGKYVPEQGLYLMERLIALYVGEVRAGRDALPKVYVITPFREVKKGLTDLLLKKSEWASRLAPHGVSVPANLEELSSHIGTVHTFQGKEADIVFFVLGCDQDRGGAMNWAASSPNLLNVAVTRAKKHCYIIGDKALWGSLNFFKIALQECAKVNG